MSGGSYNYTFYRVEDEYVGRMHDLELDKMMKDLVKVLHDLEWWQSGDMSEADYRQTVMKFKEKWFAGKREEILEDIIEEETFKLKQKLYSALYGTESEELE